MEDLTILIAGDLECAFRTYQVIVKTKIYDKVSYKHELENKYSEGLHRSIAVEIHGRNMVLDVLYHNPYLNKDQPYFRPDVDGVMMVYNFEEELSDSWISKILQNYSGIDTTNAKFILVGDDCSLQNEKPYGEFVSKIINRQRVLKSFEVNLNTGINVENALRTLINDLMEKHNPLVEGEKKKAEVTVHEEGIVQRLFSHNTLVEEEKKKAEVTVHEEGIVQRLFSHNPLVEEEKKKAEVTVHEEGIVQRLFSIFKPKDPTSAPGEFSQDPHALNLFEKAIKDGTEMDRSIRINVVGNYGQGKTTLVKRLLYKRINRVESTNGIDVQQLTGYMSGSGKITYRKANRISDDDIMDRLLTVKLTEEQQQSTALNHESQDLKLGSDKNTDRQPLTSSDESSPDEILEIEVSNILPKHLPVIIIDQTISQNTQKDAISDHVMPDTGIRKPVLSTKHKKLFVKKAKKKGKAIHQNKDTLFNFWDFGGQFIFYATHSLFHSRKAIYLLVFDLTVPLNEIFADEDIQFQPVKRSVKYYLQFWMNSIHSFVGTDDGVEPVVILVGTHKDKIKGQPEQKKKYIGKYFNDVKDLFYDTKVLSHIYKTDFAIDNMDANDPDLISLRQAILKIGEERSKTGAIPAMWIQLEKALGDIKDRKLVTIQMVLEIDASTEYPIRDIEQIKLFLQYHHAKGSLVYFDESPISDYVVLDPQFLIDAFKCIITSERFYNTDPAIRHLRKLLHTEARLEDTLIDYQWGNYKIFQENKKVLLGFLERHRIITQARLFDEVLQTCSGLSWYIVPSLLKGELFQTEVKLFLQGKPVTTLQVVLIFQVSTIVELVFHRLLSAVAGKWPIAKYMGSKAMIYKNACVVHFNNHAGILIQNAEGIRLAFVSCCPSVTVQSSEADLFRRFCESVVQHEFKKLKAGDGGQFKSYTVRYACNHEDHEGWGSNSYIAQDASNIVSCPDFLTHDIGFEKAKAEWYMIDNVTSISSNIELNEKLLSDVSLCIGENWEMLGVELGLTQVQIDHLKADNSTTMMRIYKMLLRWKSLTKAPKLQNLVAALKKTPALTVDWEGVRNVADGIY